MRRTAVDLFSGIGGFALACEWARVETIAFAEINDYASRILRKHWPGIRNYGDVRNVPAIRDVWLVTGGVPCQPASVAGKRRGTEDHRWLWPEALAVVERVRPKWVLFENPTGILSLNDGLEFERICAALEGQGYEVQPIVIPACGVGALHRRNRVWVVAHSENDGRKWSGRAWSRRNGFENKNQDVSYSINAASTRQRSNRREVHSKSESIRFDECPRGGWWTVEPNVGRVANGIPKRVDRLRCLGNAIVPQIAYQIIKRMIEAESC